MSAVSINSFFKHLELHLSKSAPEVDLKRIGELLDGVPAGEEMFLSDALQKLVRHSFPPDMAREYWKNILKHEAKLRETLGRPVGLHVAALDYFVNLTGTIREPRILECKKLDEIVSSAYLDSLTQIYNRRFFEEAMGREIYRAKRYGKDLSLLMLDIDDFKQYNDEYGHVAGDEVLRDVGTLLRQSCRDSDLPARYGGEEFAVILVETPRNTAYVIAERIRTAIAQGGGREADWTGKIHISGGVAEFPEDGDSAKLLLRSADSALYRAKGEGKNRICLSYQEKRRHPRYAARLTVSYRCTSDDQKFRGVTRDISISGLKFLAKDQPRQNDEIELEFYLPSSNHTIATKGKVVRTENASSDSGFDVGVSFADLFPAEREHLRSFFSSLEGLYSKKA